MWTLAIKAVWSFLTSKVGIALVLCGALALGVWQIYAAGARSETENAQKIVADGKAKADKEVADIQAKLTALENEKKQWKSDLDAAVEKAKTAQADIVDGLKSKLDALEKQKPIIKTVIKEVPKYVTVNADSQCTVTSGFVWLYDATLQTSSLPDSGSANADAPSGITISRVAEIAGQNNAECAERGEVIALWQEWYVKNKSLFDEISKKANSR